MHHQAYLGRENPLDAWNAVVLAGALEEPVPEWAMDYLVTCASGFQDMECVSSQDGEKPSHKDIAKILGMGSTKIFADSSIWDWVTQAIEVRDYIACGDQETYAIQHVAEIEQVSKSTIRRAWKKLQKEHPKLAGKK